MSVGTLSRPGNPDTRPQYRDDGRWVDPADASDPVAPDAADGLPARIEDAFAAVNAAEAEPMTGDEATAILAAEFPGVWFSASEHARWTNGPLGVVRTSSRSFLYRGPNGLLYTACGEGWAAAVDEVRARYAKGGF